MSFNRNLWKFFSFTQSHTPNWPCPTCGGVGTLNIVENSLHCRETSQSLQQDKRHPHWDPESEESRFSCLLVCSRSVCRESISVCGVVDVRCEQDWDRLEYAPYFIPKCFLPALPLFSIPEECPKAISNEIETAFKLYWIDPSSSSNRLRTATELILTEMGIPQYRQTKKGEQKDLILHNRINDELRPKNPDLAEAMLAVKWLGNAGSHSRHISQDDVLDGMQLMDHILQKRYEDREEIISKLYKKINQRKGPRPNLSGR